MTRPHVEFINAQALCWKNGLFGHLSSDVVAKILSRDRESGAATAIVQFPAKWQQNGACALTTAEEFLVLEGSLSLNDRAFGLACYAYLPAAYERRSASSPEGATIITFFSSGPEKTRGKVEQAPTAACPAIPFLDTFEMPWNHVDMDPEYGDTGMRWKILRHDEETRDMTFLVSSPAHFHPKNWRGPQEIHDCVEEMFLLSGDFLGDRGVMKAGAYFWRPPGLKHGPYGSRGGSLGLFRTLGADLTNNWTDNIVEISKTPKYAPLIPNDETLASSETWKPPADY